MHSLAKASHQTKVFILLVIGWQCWV